MAHSQRSTWRIVGLVPIAALAGAPSAQTPLQLCLGLTPGREPHGPVTPSPTTMQYCRQLLAWDLYEQAGRLFQSGDHAGAARVALQAAQGGNPEAQLRVAMLYPKGDGVPKDANAALRWMRAAAAQGEPMAEDLLGTIYEYGRSTSFYQIADDWDEAAKLWQASASQGYVKASSAWDEPTSMESASLSITSRFMPVAGSQTPGLAKRIAYSGRSRRDGAASGNCSRISYSPGVKLAETRNVVDSEGIQRRGSEDSGMRWLAAVVRLRRIKNTGRGL